LACGGRTCWAGAGRRNFLLRQVVFDVVLVTAAVHVTGGPTSPLPPLYILVITAGALLLPLPGGMLIGALASVLYFADLALLADGGTTGHAADRAVRRRRGCDGGGGRTAATDGPGARCGGDGAAPAAAGHGDILETIDTGLVTVDGEGHG
jgi:two-component system, NtrC family, sensor histidine kinase PilS